MWYGGNVNNFKIIQSMSKQRLNAINLYLYKHRKLKDFEALNEIHNILEEYDDIIINLDKNAFPISICFIVP
jgi:uncharacterized protein YqeY